MSNRLFILALGLFSALPAMAGSRLVYMRETSDGAKQIEMANSDGTEVKALTSGKLWHLYPDITPDGNQVAWVEGEMNEQTGPALNVVTKNLATGVVEQWTTGGGMKIHPRFSADGRFLAFSGPYGQKNLAQIALVDLQEARKQAQHVVDNDGRLVYDVTPEVIASEAASYFPAFTADGTQIYFQRTKSKTNKDVALYDRDEKKTVGVTKADGRSQEPALSFDNHYLAFTSFVDDRWDIFLADRYTGKIVQATKAPGTNLAPAFRADGSLVYANNQSGTYRLFEIPAAEIEKRTFAAKPLQIKGEGSEYAPRLSGEVSFRQSVLPSMNEPARSSFGALRLGDKIFVAGGHQGHEHTYPKESFLDKLEYFDLNTRKWVEVAPRPAPCHGYNIAGTGKYLYAFGGFAFSDAHTPKWKSLDSIDRYDVETNTWTTLKAKLFAPRSSNVVAQLGDKVYLIAGWDSTPQKKGDLEGRFLRTIEVFDMKTETNRLSKDELPNPLRRALSGVVVGDEILLVGGLGQGASHFNLLDQVTAYNPAKGTWREWPKLPFATFAPATGAIGGDLFVFGGMFKMGEGYDYVNHVFTLPAGSTEWVHSGRYVSGKKGFSMVVSLDEKTLGILGGHTYHDGTDGPVGTFETFGK